MIRTNYLLIVIGSCVGLVAGGTAYADTPSLGVGISKLTYREPLLHVTHDAWLPTVQAKWVPDDLSLMTQPLLIVGQFASGYGDYEGNGTMNHQPIHLFQLQVQSVQSDWFASYQLTPGLGYRYFHNDARGFTTTGAEGYRRSSEYWYASLGIEQQMDNNWRWAGQFSYLLFGQQTTYLGDISGDLGQLGTVKNLQRRGFGLNLGVCKKVEAWDVCPGVEYWNISDSDTQSKRINGNTYLMTEPANTTINFQLLLHYKFQE